VLKEFFTRAKGAEEEEARRGRGGQRFKISECFRVNGNGEKEKESDYIELDWGTGQYKLLRKTKKTKG